MSYFPEHVFIGRDDDICVLEIEHDVDFIDVYDSSQQYIRSDLVPQWQPIETAPKDGTWIMLTGGRIGWDIKSESKVVIGQASSVLNGRVEENYRWQFAWYNGGYHGEYSNPTHWMPIPNVPE